MIAERRIRFLIETCQRHTHLLECMERDKKEQGDISYIAVPKEIAKVVGRLAEMCEQSYVDGKSVAIELKIDNGYFVVRHTFSEPKEAPYIPEDLLPKKKTIKIKVEE